MDTRKETGERRCFKGHGMAEYREQSENLGVEKFNMEEGKGIWKKMGEGKMVNQNQDIIENP